MRHPKQRKKDFFNDKQNNMLKKTDWDKIPKPDWDVFDEWDDYLSGGLETNDEKQSDDDRKRIE